jgi:hypothetical protein
MLPARLEGMADVSTAQICSPLFALFVLLAILS